jgi:hypothetical protein
MQGKLMSRTGIVRFFAACGVLVSSLVFLAGAYVIFAVFVDFTHQERFLRANPALNLHPESMLFNPSFGYICLTFLLSIILGATAVGLLVERAWATRAAKFVVPCFSWVLFLGVSWTYHHVARTPSEAMFVIGPGLIEAILAFYVLPWFIAISTLWFVLLPRKSNAAGAAFTKPSGRNV